MGAPKDNKNAAGNNGGRPSKYKEEYITQAYKLALLGATDKEMAEFFGIAERVLNRWKKVYFEFSQSLKKGKVMADANVANRLYQRALGYKHREDKIFNDNGQALIVPTVKHYPPDPTSIIFWLKNRQKEKWRDRIDGTMEITRTIEAMTDEQLDYIIQKLKNPNNDAKSPTED